MNLFCFRKHYFEVRRLEDGFDLSGTDSPKLDHPPLKSVRVQCLHNVSILLLIICIISCHFNHSFITLTPVAMDIIHDEGQLDEKVLKKDWLNETSLKTRHMIL